MNLRIPAPLAVPALGLAALLAGCTSDLPNEVGGDLGTVVVDSLLVPLRPTTLAAHSQLTVTDDTGRPFPRLDVLYLGSQEGTSSAILVNFDFSDTSLVRNDSMTVDMVTAGNITSPRLRLNMLDFYRTVERPDGSGAVGLRKFYEIYRLDAPFDTTAAWPGAIPPHGALRLNASIEPDDGTSFIIEIDLLAQDLVGWLLAGERVGFLIQEGPAPADVDSGMVGFSSRENRYPASTIVPDDDVTVRRIGPTLRCKFAAENLEWSMGSVADVSTFHEIAVPPGPDEAITLRTYLRSYPALLFDLSLLPRDVYINRAALVVHNDTLTSYGNLQNLVVSELDTTYFGGAGNDLTLDGLDDAVDFTVTRITSADPTYNVRFEFDVTTWLQRRINGVTVGTRGLLLTGGEAIVGDLSSMGPGFWLSQFNFRGTADPDSTLRPRLEIRYSSADGLGEGAHD